MTSLEKFNEIVRLTPISSERHPSIYAEMIQCEEIFVTSEMDGFFYPSQGSREAIGRINKFLSNGSSIKWSAVSEIGLIKAHRESLQVTDESSQRNNRFHDDASKNLSKLFISIIRIGIQNRASDIKIQINKEGIQPVIVMRVAGEYRSLEVKESLSREKLISMCLNVIDFYAHVKNVAVNKFTVDNIINEQIPFDYDGRKLNLRFGSMPGEQGSCSITIRIPNTAQNSEPRKLDELGFLPVQLKLIQKALKERDGAVYFTAPTNNGKTTTVASCLSELPYYTSVITAQDPIEINLQRPAMNHVPVDPSSQDMSWEAVLAQMLRQDPDVIFIGEIRSEEVARQMAIIADTGSLVLTTLHVPTALKVPRKLASYAIPQHDLRNDSLFRLIVGVRLIGRTCTHCRVSLGDDSGTEGLPSIKRLREYFSDSIHSVHLRNPNGCHECEHTGLTGKKLIAEVYKPDEQSLPLLLDNRIEEARSIISQKGFISLKDHAERDIRSGILCPLTVEAELSVEYGGLSDHSFDYVEFERLYCADDAK